MKSAPRSAISSRAFAYSSTVSLNYEVFGRGQRALILLHGFGASRESWRDITPLLERDYAIYALDLKGFGLSSKTQDSTYSVEDQAIIVRAFVASLSRGPVTLIGHSYGGGVALMTLLASGPTNPQIDSLVLIDSAAYPQKFPVFIQISRSRILQTLTNLLPARARAAYILRSVMHNRDVVTEERIDRYAKYFDLPGAHHAFRQTASQIIPKEIDHFLRGIKTLSSFSRKIAHHST